MPEPYFNAPKVNLDGSRNIYCNRCHEFICSISCVEAFNSALCIVCQAADRGEVFSEEQLRELRSVRIGHNFVPVFIADPVIPVDPMATDDLDLKTGRIEYFSKVVTRTVRKIVAEVKAASKESRALAKEKKKPRVFDQPID